MTDTTTASNTLATPASPVPQYKLKECRSPGSPTHGCEHIQRLLSGDTSKTEQSIRHYASILQLLNQKPSVLAQTTTADVPKDGKPVKAPITTILPTYMCLQCSNISDVGDRDVHSKSSSHDFAVESRSGRIYCGLCKDYIYDPTLEGYRTQRVPFTAFPGHRKRKLDALYPVSDDLRFINQNTIKAPCRATGVRGLYNMGQTCYMNAVLQSLIHNPILRNSYLGDGHRAKDCERQDCLSCTMDEMFAEFYGVGKTEAYAPSDHVIRLWTRDVSWAGSKQQDAHEYWQALVNFLHTDSSPNELLKPLAHSTPVNGSRSDSKCPCVIHQTFEGQLRSDITCQTCSYLSPTWEPFIDLSLDLRSQVESQVKKQKRQLQKKVGGVTLNGTASPLSNPSDARLSIHDCLRNYTSAEVMDGYHCPQCKERGTTPSKKHETATKRLSVNKLPQSLCVQLKRFEGGFTATTQKASRKLYTRVDFPLQLDMSPYTTRYLSATNPRAKASLSSSSSSSSTATSSPSIVADSKIALNGASTKPLPVTAEVKEQCSFDLQAVVVHIGGLNGGHYVAYCRSGTEWHKFDDNKVTVATERQVLAEEAYLLMYTVRSVT